MSDLFKNLEGPEPDPDSKLADLYRVEKSNRWGFTADGRMMFGFILAPLDSDRLDFIQEEVNNAGDDIKIIIPKGGLVEGATYRAVSVNISRDWETGYVDGYDIALVPVEPQPEELDPVEAMERALERSGIPT